MPSIRRSEERKIINLELYQITPYKRRLQATKPATTRYHSSEKKKKKNVFNDQHKC